MEVFAEIAVSVSTGVRSVDDPDEFTVFTGLCSMIAVERRIE